MQDIAKRLEIFPKHHSKGLRAWGAEGRPEDTCSACAASQHLCGEEHSALGAWLQPLGQTLAPLLAAAT